MRGASISYVVVGRPAVPDNHLARLVVPDRVGERRAGGHVLAIQMANAELTRPLLILVHHEQCRVSAVLGREESVSGGDG